VEGTQNLNSQTSNRNYLVFSFDAFEGVCITKEKEPGKKNFKARNLEEITMPALSKLKTENEAAYEHLIALVREGYLERHQTKGKIVQISDALLTKLRGNINNEDQLDRT
jgi:hypothetical protein